MRSVAGCDLERSDCDVARGARSRIRVSSVGMSPWPASAWPAARTWTRQFLEQHQRPADAAGVEDGTVNAGPRPIRRLPSLSAAVADKDSTVGTSRRALGLEARIAKLEIGIQRSGRRGWRSRRKLRGCGRRRGHGMRRMRPYGRPLQPARRGARSRPAIYSAMRQGGSGAGGGAQAADICTPPDLGVWLRSQRGTCDGVIVERRKRQCWSVYMGSDVYAAVVVVNFLSCLNSAITQILSRTQSGRARWVG